MIVPQEIGKQKAGFYTAGKGFSMTFKPFGFRRNQQVQEVKGVKGVVVSKYNPNIVLLRPAGVDPKNGDVEAMEAMDVKTINMEAWESMDGMNIENGISEINNIKAMNSIKSDTMIITDYYGTTSRKDAIEKALHACKQKLKSSISIGANKVAKKGITEKKAVMKNVAMKGMATKKLTMKNFFTL